jgi:hypothetical protein
MTGGEMPKEKNTEVKEKEKEVSYLVVPELPTQPVRVLVDGKNNEHTVLKIEEALTELVNDVKEIKKTLV